MSQLEAAKVIEGVKGVRIVASDELYPASGTGLPLLEIENTLGRALLAFQGAHLMSFVPQGGKDLLWLSPTTEFEAGKAIRGGIPLCMPWFGGHPDGLPAHGFARNRDWQLAAASNAADGATEIVMELRDNEETRALWDTAFCFRLTIRIGRELTLKLDVANEGDKDMPFTYAFHTYFSVPDYQALEVRGLEDLEYINTVGTVRREHQNGILKLAGTTDRVYLNVPAVQNIVCADRTIRIEGGQKCAIVWNPGEFALQIADIGDAYTGYVCVERGDAFDYALTLPAHGHFSSVMTLSA